MGPRRGAGGSKPFGKFALVVGVFWSFRRSGRLASFTVSFRLFSGPPGGRPHARLKVGTPREAPTPAPTTKTPLPTTVNRRITRADAKWRAPTFSFISWRVKLRRPRSPASIPRFDVPPEQRSWSRNLSRVVNQRMTPGRAVGLHDCSGETCSLSEETKAPQRQQLVPRDTTRPREPATLPSAVQAVGVPAVVSDLSGLF